MLAEIVKKRREELGYSRSDLAKLAECSKSTMWRFENIPLYNPRGITFIKMAKALELSIDDLLD